MIKLEITQSPDPLTIGIYDYSFDQVFIGRSKKCDLIFLENQFPPCYLTLSINENNLSVSQNISGPSFLINGKKTSGVSKLKINDNIKIGGYIIKVLDFKNTVIPLDLSPFYEQVNDATPEVQQALKDLEEQLAELEKETNV